MNSARLAPLAELAPKRLLDRAVTGSWARYEMLYRNPLIMGVVLFLIVCGVIMLEPMTSYRFFYGDF